MIDLAIAHASFAEGRPGSLLRLVEQIDKPDDVHIEIFESPAPEHASTWAKRIYEYIAKHDKPVCILNDDVTVCPDFCKVLDSYEERLKDGPISLMVTNPDALTLYREGHNWVRIYHYTGPGVILTPDHAKSLLEWTEKCPDEFKLRQNEDGCAVQWAWDRQVPFYAPLPSPIDHDAGIPSTLGYDNHILRTAAVPWGTEREELGLGVIVIPFIENPWRNLAHIETISKLLKLKCALCKTRIALVGTPEVHICSQCILNLAAALINRVQFPW